MCDLTMQHEIIFNNYFLYPPLLRAYHSLILFNRCVKVELCLYKNMFNKMHLQIFSFICQELQTTKKCLATPHLITFFMEQKSLFKTSRRIYILYILFATTLAGYQINIFCVTYKLKNLLFCICIWQPNKYTKQITRKNYYKYHSTCYIFQLSSCFCLLFWKIKMMI